MLLANPYGDAFNAPYTNLIEDSFCSCDIAESDEAGIQVDTPDRPQHGIDGPHHNIFRAQQIPKGIPGRECD